MHAIYTVRATRVVYAPTSQPREVGAANTVPPCVSKVDGTKISSQDLTLTSKTPHPLPKSC